ncbi:hypothetical protein VTK56DRAFT_4319 [Thermocarpiscus australiensis]
MIEFIRQIEKLQSPRRGWPKRGVPESAAETIAEHMYQMAMVIMAYPWGDDTQRMAALEMSIVHDAPEAIAGDVIPSDNMSQETKRAREELGLQFLACLAKESKMDAFADRITRLWKEYEEGITPVSRIVRQVDKFQALTQAYLYSCRYPELSRQLGDFKSHRNEIMDPWLAEKADDILHAWDAADSRKRSDLVFIFVVGGPGVGKGTQCERAARNFGLKHVSVGELLRRERSLPSSLYKDFIGNSFREGVPVPPTLVMKLLSVELQGLGADGNGVSGMILDGFPLTQDQLKAFEEEISPRYSTIVMECPAEVMLQRLTKRAMSSNREDDTPEKIKKRIESFKNLGTECLLNQLSKNALYKVQTLYFFIGKAS